MHRIAACGLALTTAKPQAAPAILPQSLLTRRLGKLRLPVVECSVLPYTDSHRSVVPGLSVGPPRNALLSAPLVRFAGRQARPREPRHRSQSTVTGPSAAESAVGLRRSALAGPKRAEP